MSTPGVKALVLAAAMQRTSLASGCNEAMIGRGVSVEVGDGGDIFRAEPVYMPRTIMTCVCLE